MKIPGGFFVNLVKSLPFIFLGVALNPGGDGHPSLLGEETKRLTEFDALLFHNKRENIATGAAGPETVPALPLREDKERRGFLFVEGAACLEIATGLGQRDMLANDLNNIQLLFYFVDNAH